MIPILMPGRLGKASGGPPPFSPLDITGCGLWLDMIDTATLFDATSGGSLPSIGNGVARIEDKSGNGRHYTQGTSGNQPLRDAAGLSFDGSDDHMLQTAGMDITRNVSGLSIVAVCTSTTGAGIRGMWASSTNTAGFVRNEITSGRTTSRFTLGGRRNNTDGFQGITDGSNYTNDTKYIITGLIDYANADAFLFRDGTQVASSTSFLTAGNTADTDSAQVSLGRVVANLAQVWSGLICEVLVYRNKVLTTDEREDLEAYLTAKHGI